MVLAHSHKRWPSTKAGCMLLLVLSLLCIATGESCTASTPSPLLILLVDTLDPMEIAADSVWRNLAHKGAYGLMNTRTGGRNHAAATHLSIGTGARADAPTAAAQTFALTEKVNTLTAGELYQSLTGTQPPANSLVCIDIARLVRANTARPDITIGWLGEQLKAAQISVAHIGNADTPTEQSRPGTLLLMDSQGVIPQGAVGAELLLFDAAFPYQLRTNYVATLEAIAALAHNQVLVVELADLARLDSYREYLDEAQWQQHRQTTLTEIGLFIHHLMTQPTVAKRTVLIVSPSPRADRVAAGHWLAPILLLQPDLSGTLLHSQGTRRPGILLNTEIAGAIVDLATSGTAAVLRQTPLRKDTANAPSDATAQLIPTYQRIIALQHMRAPILQSYVLFCVGVFLAAVPVLWQISLGNLRLAVVWEYVLLVVAAFPLAALLLAIFPNTNTLWALLLVTVLSIVLAWTAKQLGRQKLDPFLLLFGSTTICLLLDLLNGAPLVQWSVLGYDVIGGARFYGIGNEYGGVLLTATLMTVGILLHRFPTRSNTLLAIPFLLITAIIAGAPWWGANNGVAASAVLGFTLTVYFLLQAPFSWRAILTAGILLVLFASVAIVLDLTLNAANPSHLGQLAKQVLAEGLTPIWVMATRKLAMNWKLLRYTIWTKVLLSSLAVSLLLILRPIAWVQRYLQPSPSLQAAAKGALVTALFLLVLNDSGVVAAATAMIPVTTLLLFLAARSLAMQHVKVE